MLTQTLLTGSSTFTLAHLYANQNPAHRRFYLADVSASLYHPFIYYVAKVAHAYFVWSI